MGHSTASGRTAESAAAITPVSTESRIFNDRVYRVYKTQKNKYSV